MARYGVFQLFLKKKTLLALLKTLFLYFWTLIEKIVDLGVGGSNPLIHPFHQKRPFGENVKRLNLFYTNTYVANMSVRTCFTAKSIFNAKLA